MYVYFEIKLSHAQLLVFRSRYMKYSRIPVPTGPVNLGSGVYMN